MRGSNPKCVGGICGDEIVDGMDAPLVDVNHADCNKDTDPDCQTSVQPLFDKSQSGSSLKQRKMSANAASRDFDAYFALQQKDAMRKRVAIKPVMHAKSHFHDRAGTKFGISAAQAQAQTQAIFNRFSEQDAKEDESASIKRAHSFTARTAKSDLGKYWSQLASSKHAFNNGMLKDTNRGKMNKISAQKADSEILAYFNSMSKKSRRQSLRQTATPAHYTVSESNKDLNSYFNHLAATRHGANNNHLKDTIPQPSVAKGQLHGITANQASKDFSKYFSSQAKIAGKARKPSHMYSSADAKSDLGHYFAKQQKLAAEVEYKKPEKECIGKDCQSSRSPLLEKAPKGSLKQVSEKHGLSDAAARKDIAKYFQKEQKLAEYGVGPEEDHAIEVNKAIGVDAMMPESVMESNEAPSSETIDEVNQAIQQQRSEGYTNGNGMPAEDIQSP
ncbi:hypothetical protein GUITHDRAFT_150074 [Guillardia theta CCMP2712]|uniref:Uncharacterized protein n=1 Tax=Guillardia theta (strain CCMP2712) TaxID=905079 RepID=L1K224_GUITC|nr:hypothetical protein GUITHDRAFT_150074 [Guillardia theta CCMP2712]EKX54647.1 hypothetical protein GUITHDRAFT_150074 [Guillardia theta CCMP2712]|eukprot:XP_005841627.1 hypothetical protein GUITHDRAFT_150074 [Guillardia theta CCMP2712]